MGIKVTVITKGLTNATVQSGSAPTVGVSFPGGGSSSGAGATKFSDLTDVDVSAVEDGSPIIYDANTAKYTAEDMINGGTF